MRLKQKVINLTLLAVAAFLICFSSSESFASQKKNKQTKPAASKAGQVVDLHKIDQLKEAFQRDSGKVRFVTILSPT
jgi:hypothetical protein